MDTQNIILIVVSILVSYILFKILKSALKILVPLIIISAGAYYIYTTMTSTNFIAKFEAVYCQDETPDEVKCECVTQLVLNDIKQNKSSEELQEISQNSVKSLDLIKDSLLKNRENITSCLEDKGYKMTSFDDILAELKSLVN